MAYVENIWIMGGAGAKENQVTVNINLQPSGSDRIYVDVPPDFYNCLLKIAQAAADLHEQKMRAQILADHAVDGVDPTVISPLQKPPMRCG